MTQQLEQPGSEGRILVVDDVQNNRLLLSRRLERRGYEVEQAAGGREALDMIADSAFDAVLLDILMPEMDGFAVLEAIRMTQSPEELPVIMVTAREDSEDVVRALEIGANDYVTKPIDLAVCIARLRTHLKLKNSSQTIKDANTRMRDDLDAAARIQQSLLPSVQPSFRGANFSWSYSPCDDLGGDILNIFAIDDDHVAFYLIDVSGHGVRAALMAVTLSRLLIPQPNQATILGRPVRAPAPARTAPGPDGDAAEYIIAPPAEVARRLNRQFQMDVANTQYFTLFYGMLDLNTRELQYVSAGHPAPLCVTSEGRDKSHADPGPPIGWFDEVEYDEQSLSLGPGDRLYVWSDGIIEATNATGDFYGYDNLAATLQGSRETPLGESTNAIVDQIRAWTGGAPQDDVSIIGLEIE